MFKGLKDFRRYEFWALAQSNDVFNFVSKNLDIEIETNLVLHCQTFGKEEVICHGGKLLDVWNSHGVFAILTALLKVYEAREIHSEIRYFLPQVRWKEEMIRLIESIEKIGKKGVFPIEAASLLKKAAEFADNSPSECGHDSRDFLHLEKGVRLISFVKNKYGNNTANEIEYFVFGTGRIELYDYAGPNGGEPIEFIDIDYTPSEEVIEIFFEDMYERGYKMLSK